MGVPRACIFVARVALMLLRAAMAEASLGKTTLASTVAEVASKRLAVAYDTL